MSSTTVRRRAVLLGPPALVLGGAAAGGPGAGPAAAIAENPVEVASYLPAAAGLDGFFDFVPSDRETPAIRAGTIAKYRFSMPGPWVRRTVANILSGNYCQPRCDEP